MNRKYRQPGYQDDGDRGEPRKRTVRTQTRREGPRSPRMMGFQKLFRCAMCGTSLPPSFTDIEADSQCPKCSSDLHTCRNCVYFDTSSRFECTQPILKRVTPKDRANKCRYFEAKTRVEKKTSSASEGRTSRATGALDPREAFENLFKK